MKVFFIVLFFLSVKLFAQAPADSLKKYSYLFKVNIPDSIKIINGITYYKWYQSTGFFISAKGKTYLVSAAHSLLGLHHANEPNPRLKKPTVFHLFINKLHSKIVERIPLDLAGSIPDLDSSYFKNNPDFYCVPVTIPSGYEVHTINSFSQRMVKTTIKLYMGSCMAILKIVS